MQSMKFSEQKLQDIGLGTCLPAASSGKGWRPRLEQKRSYPCSYAGKRASVTLRLTPAQLTEENVKQTANTGTGPKHLVPSNWNLKSRPNAS